MAVLEQRAAPYGIIRTPWKQWVQQAMAANYHVAILRLAPQYLSLFNETAANQWFYTVQGMPYGWHNVRRVAPPRSLARARATDPSFS